MQRTQYVAQKFTSTTLPRRSEVARLSPDSIVNRTSGAGGGCLSSIAAATNIAGRSTSTMNFFMRSVIFGCFAAGVMTWAPCALAQLDRITSREAASGLKAALEKGSTAAVASLGRTDGFFGNPQGKIALSQSMQPAEKLIRPFGPGKHADRRILTLNRAAQAALP